MFDPESETFVVHVASLSSDASPSSSPLNIHPSQIEQRFILRTRLFIVYAVGRYFRLWELSVFCPLVEEWGYHFSSVTGWCRVWAVGWTQSNTFLSCANVSLVIGIGQGYWLDDRGSPSECHRLDDKGAPSICNWYWSGMTRWRKADSSKLSLRQGCS